MNRVNWNNKTKMWIIVDAIAYKMQFFSLFFPFSSCSLQKFMHSSRFANQNPFTVHILFVVLLQNEWKKKQRLFVFSRFIHFFIRIFICIYYVFGCLCTKWKSICCCRCRHWKHFFSYFFACLLPCSSCDSIYLFVGLFICFALNRIHLVRYSFSLQRKRAIFCCCCCHRQPFVLFLFYHRLDKLHTIVNFL